MTEEKLYTIKELSLATGMNVKTLHSRRKERGVAANRGGYTLDEIKIILKRPTRRKATNKNARELRARLLNDGAL